MNRTIFTGDNLDILRGLNSGSVDLIYLDPPFNSNRNYSAPIGSEAAGAAFRDTWTLDDVDLAWHGEIAERSPALYSVIQSAGLSHGPSMKSYLIMMAVRLLEMRRVLAERGSIYLHCDPTASHYLKALMDSIFGAKQFLNEVVWTYAKWSNTARYFQRNHDILLAYSQKDRYTFNVQKVLSADKLAKIDKGYQFNRPNGKKQLIVYDEAKAAHKIDEGGYDRIVRRPVEGSPMSDSWHDINILNSQAKERTGYPTQKPLALLDRIIRASSNEGDTVLDPFCGCATTLVAAEKLNRRWIGCDLSPLAASLILERFDRECGGLVVDVNHRADIPRRTDQGKLPHYRTHKHTLYGKQEGVCAGCQTHFAFRHLEVDHIQPRKRGGSDHLNNLQLLCGHCNRLKGAGSQEQLIAKLIKLGLRD